MRWVVVSREEHPVPANLVDPQGYLERLPDLRSQLPIGARAFATDPDHYDFGSLRCVKDLRLLGITMREAGNASLESVIEFGPNRFKHDVGLTIAYTGVSDLRVSPKPGVSGNVWPTTPRMGDLQLDEILPLKGGCSHEIEMTGGSIFVECADLVACWG